MSRNPVVYSGIHSMQQRLDLIAEQIDKSVTSLQENGQGQKYMLQNLAFELVKGCPEHGIEGEDCCVTRIFWWVKNNIEYRQDPTDYDQYRAAGSTIAAGGADCDDMCILICALLSTIGFRVGARVCSADGQNWHIYAVCGVHTQGRPTEVVPLDTTQPQSYPGWEPPKPHTNYLYQCDFGHGKARGLTKVH